MSEARGTSRALALARAHWRTTMMMVVAALGALVLVALIVTLGNANRQRDRALSLQSHSFEVMILTRSLAGTMARAEAMLGRFVISADKTLGQEYFEEWLMAGRQIDRLDDLTGDNPLQQARVERLRAAYRERGEELSLIALATRYKKNNQALARFYRARDAAALRTISRLLEDAIADERTLLTERTDAAMTSVARSNALAKLLAGFGVALVVGAIALGWFTSRALTARAVSQAEADAERERAAALEDAIAAATAEIKAQAAEREVAEAKLRQMQKLDAVGQLTGGIAHDFNNMLAVVIGGLELAKRRLSDGGDVERHLDSAAEGAARATALTRRLLAFARSEPLAPQAVAPSGLVAGMSDLLDRTLGDGISVDARDESAGGHVWVDVHGLENAILNLAVNARDAMEGRGTLSIVTGSTLLTAGAVGECAAGDYVTIAVGDSGCGMSEDVLERVFEPFFTTKPVGRGTGLGLSQIFGFVRQSGGEVGIASVEGEGTVVTLYLPRHAAASRPPLRPAALVIEAHEATDTAYDILVVEDDARVLAATVGALTELGHRPVACDDPLMAASTLATMPPPDLIMSDVLMPGMTGPEVVAQLRGSAPHAAVLFVTGYAGDAADHTGFEGHQVLRKPYTIAALSAAIDSAVASRSTRGNTEPPMRIAATG